VGGGGGAVGKRGGEHSNVAEHKGKNVALPELGGRPKRSARLVNYV